MLPTEIYKALTHVKKRDQQIIKLKNICQKLTEMGLVRNTDNDRSAIPYELTIKGKLFLWDYKQDKQRI